MLLCLVVCLALLNILSSFLLHISLTCNSYPRLGEYTQEDLSSDLHKLSEHTPPLLHTSVHDDDIDPLLQVYTQSGLNIYMYRHLFQISRLTYL